MPISNPTVTIRPIFYSLAGMENHPLSGTNTWEDWDLAAIIPVGTIYVLIECYTTAGGWYLGVRKKGSGLSRKIHNADGMCETSSTIVLTEVGSDRKVEIFGHTTNTCYTVKGYWINE